MKVISIFLALVNTLFAGLVLLSCFSASNLRWEALGWLAVRVAAGALVVLIGALTLRDGVQPLRPGKMLAAGLSLVLIGAGSAMWGIHLSILSGDVKNVMILFGGSLVMQGVASALGIQETTV
jgi:hypothetical protein